MSSAQRSMHCDCTRVCEETYETSSDRTPSEAVVAALATAEGVDPLDLTPLHYSIDVDALNRLFEQNESVDTQSPVLSWTVDGWNVFVRGDGRVVICDPDRSPNLSPIFDDADSKQRTAE